jgi:sugar lactone lactonase YvrE
MARSRQVVGLLTLLALILIVLGVSGVQVSLPGGGAAQAALPGIRARATSTLLRAPQGGELAFLAVEPSGNLVVTDAKRASVLRFDPTGQLLSEWGPQLGTTRLVEPAGVAVAGDSYYVVDRGMPRVFRLDNTGQPQSVINVQPLGPYGLNGVAVDAGGNVYVADTGRNRILVFSPAGQLLKQVGHSGTDLGGFTQPMMLAFAPDGSLFVSDWENTRVERFNADMDATDAWPLGYHAYGIAVDGMGRVYTPDFDHRRVDAYTPQGGSLGEVGGPEAPLLATTPKQVAVARSAEPSLYVLGSDQIQRLDLQNTPPPPQSSSGPDLLSVLVIVVMLAVVVLAVFARRRRSRRAVPSLGAALDRPVGLNAKNGAQSQRQQPEADEQLLIAHKAEREQ